jgi:hypothetical protein
MKMRSAGLPWSHPAQSRRVPLDIPQEFLRVPSSMRPLSAAIILTDLTQARGSRVPESRVRPELYFARLGGRERA